MSAVKFPKKRVDGSFCVELALPVVTSHPDELLQRVQQWAVSWRQANEVWVRDWKSTAGEKEHLNYDSEFKQAPKPVSRTSSELRIQLEAKPSAKWWRDWMVLRLINDLKLAFPEIQTGGMVKNCDEGETRSPSC
jgi:hypothetical protein